MKNLTIDYKRNFGEDGTIYTQTITTTTEIIKKYNIFIEKVKEKIHKKFTFDDKDLKALTYLKTLSSNDINYLHLTELDYFKTFYVKEIYQAPNRDIDFERILKRNTIIKIK